MQAGWIMLRTKGSWAERRNCLSNGRFLNLAQAADLQFVVCAEKNR